MSHAQAGWVADKIRFEERADWLIEVAPEDPGGESTTLRFSRHGFASATGLTLAPEALGRGPVPVVIAPHTPYEKRLVEAPVIRQALWSAGKIGGASWRKPGQVVLANADGGLDQYMETEGWKWRGRPIVVYLVDRDQPEGTLFERFRGYVQDAKWSLESVTLKLVGPESIFASPVSSRVYRGNPWTLELAAGTTNATVGFGTPAKLSITGDLTASFWVWFEAYGTVGHTVYGYQGGTGVPWRVSVSNDGLPFVTATVGGTATNVGSGIQVGLQRWCHVAVVIDGLDVTFMVFDERTQEEQVAHVAGAFSSPSRDTASGGVAFQLRSASGRQAWVNECRLFDKALSLEEVRADRHLPLDRTALPASCKHYVPVTDGTGSTVTDFSASPASGTIATGGGTAGTLWIPTAEGTEELAGTPKPDLWGHRFGIVPLEVNGAHQIYQIAAEEVAGVDAVSRGGLLYGSVPYTNASSMRAFLTTTPSSGAVLRYNAEGLFRLGDTPTLPLLVSGRGYLTGAGEAQSAGQILRDIVTRRGGLVDPEDLDVDLFAAIDDAAPHVLGFHLHESVPIAEACDRVMASIMGAWGYFGEGNLLGVMRFEGPSPEPHWEFDARHIVSLTPLDTDTIWHEVRVRYRPSDLALSAEQLAGALPPTQRAQWQREYLEVLSRSQTVRRDWPGAASRAGEVETLIRYTGGSLGHDSTAPIQGARHEAATRMALFGVPRTAYRLVLDVTGAAVRVGDTVALTYVTQDNVTRLNLAGKRFVVLSVDTALQRGEVAMEVWG